MGTLPAGWDYYTFWQYADSRAFPGDQDRFKDWWLAARTSRTDHRPVGAPTTGAPTTGAPAVEPPPEPP